MMKLTFLAILALGYYIHHTQSFCYTCSPSLSATKTFSRTHKVPVLRSTSNSNEQVLLEEVKQMRAGEIKKELNSVGVSCDDVFEKEELVRRLMNYRREKGPSASTPAQENRDTHQSPLPRTTAQKVVVPIEILRGAMGNPKNYITCEVVIAGSRHRFIIDTGASSCLITSDLKQQLGLQPIRGVQGGAITGGGIGGAGDVVQLNSMLIGGVGCTMQAFVFQAGAGMFPMEVSGLLGMDFLRQFTCADFNFSAGELNLIQSTGGNYDMFTGEEMSKLGLQQASLSNHPFGLVCTNMELQGGSSSGSCQLTVLVDLGSTYSIVNEMAAKQAEMSKNADFVERAALVSGLDGRPLNVGRGNFYKVSVGSRHSLYNYPVYVADIPGLQQIGIGAGSPAGLVGLDILGNKRTVIDFKNLKLYFSA